MTLDYVLNSRNIDGRIYLSDVMIFFNLDAKRAYDMRDKLEQISNMKGAE